MADIHSTAIIAPGAVIGEGTLVGPYSVIGPHVVLGKQNRIGAHVVLDGHTTFGDENQVFPFASVGTIPQDLKYRGEASRLTIGNKNLIREYVTIQPGTQGGGMLTSIGSGNLFMANSHVGHDSHVGNKNIIANSCALAGHVTVGSGVTIGGLSAIHQFVKLGDLGFIGGGAMVSLDLPPYCMAQGDRAGVVGVNIVGLERNGFSAEQVERMKKLYRTVYVAKGLFKAKLEQARSEFGSFAECAAFLDFIAASERGVMTLRRASN